MNTFVSRFSYDIHEASASLGPFSARELFRTFLIHSLCVWAEIHVVLWISGKS